MTEKQAMIKSSKLWIAYLKKKKRGYKRAISLIDKCIKNTETIIK